MLFKLDKTVNLVTVATPLDQNLALLDVDEHLSAESLAVIHEGYVNVIPILNTMRRSKYVPLSQGCDRGKGSIKQVKWVRIQGETVFVVLSDSGLQVYDADISDIKFFHACRETGDEHSYTIGVCVVKNDILCIGTHLGTVWMFRGNEGNTNFTVTGRFYAHDEAITLMDGFEEYMVTSSDVMTYMWLFKSGSFEIVRKLDVRGLFSKPTSLKITNCLTFIGYDSGEFCIFDFFDEDYFARTIAHKLKVTAIDFSALTGYILTVSQDSYVKIWKFIQDASEAQFLFCTFNDDGPICGGAFLNYTCTEFCTVTADSVNVKFYLKWDSDDEEVGKPKQSESKEDILKLGKDIIV
ncbi:hypothetical protein Trydic_g17917 [Trypoxylus dichotomus]